jgi:hypothetical protein
MAIRTELSLRLPNSPGALGRVCEHLASSHVNLLALHLESSGRLRIIVDNPLHAAAMLRERQLQVEEREVLVAALPNTPGTLGRLSRALTEAGINIEYAYASVSDEGPSAAIVLGVPDAAKAAMVAGL